MHKGLPKVAVLSQEQQSDDFKVPNADEPRMICLEQPDDGKVMLPSDCSELWRGSTISDVLNRPPPEHPSRQTLRSQQPSAAASHLLQMLLVPCPLSIMLMWEWKGDGCRRST